MSDAKRPSYKGGYIKDGVYIARQANASEFVSADTSQYKQSEHDRQRKDHAKDIIQPYDAQGKPNEDFINAYPVEAQTYGFVPTIEQLNNGDI